MRVLEFLEKISKFIKQIIRYTQTLCIECAIHLSLAD